LLAKLKKRAAILERQIRMSGPISCIHCEFEFTSRFIDLSELELYDHNQPDAIIYFDCPWCDSDLVIETSFNGIVARFIQECRNTEEIWKMMSQSANNIVTRMVIEKSFDLNKILVFFSELLSNLTCEEWKLKINRPLSTQQKQCIFSKHRDEISKLKHKLHILEAKSNETGNGSCAIALRVNIASLTSQLKKFD
jgi:hypothetical protein